MRYLFLLLIIYPLGIHAQRAHFEGVIKFSIDYYSQTNQINIEKYKSMFGDSYTCYIKPGFYRQDYSNSKGMSYVIYNYKTNKYYFKFNGIDTLFYKDCSVEKNEIKVKNIDTSMNVLNYKCSSIEIKSNKYTARYFYTKKLFVDPKYYKNHKMGGYDLLTLNTKSIYLKLILDFGFLKTINQAVSIEEKKIDDKVFDLPNLPLKEK